MHSATSASPPPVRILALQDASGSFALPGPAPLSRSASDMANTVHDPMPVGGFHPANPPGSHDNALGGQRPETSYTHPATTAHAPTTTSRGFTTQNATPLTPDPPWPSYFPIRIPSVPPSLERPASPPVLPQVARCSSAGEVISTWSSAQPVLKGDDTAHSVPPRMDPTQHGASLHHRAPTATRGTAPDRLPTAPTARPLCEIDPNSIAVATHSAYISTHFGQEVWSKVVLVLPELVRRIPLGVDRSTVYLAEFGSINACSIPLLRPIVREFVRHMEAPVFPPQDAFALPGASSPHDDVTPPFDVVNLVVVDERTRQRDMDSFAQWGTRYESGMYAESEGTSELLSHAIFSSFVSRPFGSRIAPQRTLHFGLSLMDLHWPHASHPMQLSSEAKAQAELTMFLSARAREFRKGGVFVMAFIARSEPSGRERSQDIWNVLTDMLAPCLQRLVSCGIIKSHLARQLITLPLYARTPSQTMAALKELDSLWTLEWSCGVGKDHPLPSTHSTRGETHVASEPSPLRLPLPATAAWRSGKISQAHYSELVIQMFKSLYESHFRVVLHEQGKLSKGAAEFVLDSLWDVLSSRIGEPEMCPIFNCELEVQLIALRCN